MFPLKKNLLNVSLEGKGCETKENTLSEWVVHRTAIQTVVGEVNAGVGSHSKYHVGVSDCVIGTLKGLMYSGVLSKEST